MIERYKYLKKLDGKGERERKKFLNKTLYKYMV
jgi:hypothetical protein